MTGKPSPDPSPSPTEDRAAPRLWQRVRRWLHRSLGTRVPRPMPILLEDLYPPPARSVYRSVRAWEQNLVCALEDLDALERAEAAHLAERTCELARALRRYLLLVQRLRYLVSSTSLEPESHALYAAWKQHRVAWTGGIASAVEALGRASVPFVGAEPCPSPGACEELRAVIETVAAQTEERTVALLGALRAAAGSARRSS